MKFSRALSKAICQAKVGQKKPPALLLLAGWLVLVLYVLDYSPVGVFAAAFAGSFDSTHEARVQSGEHGLQLVLHHTQGCVGHHHGVVARTLTFFAQPATATNPDHVIQFGSADKYACPTQMLQPTPTHADLLEFTFNGISLPVLNPAFAASQAPRPPPSECGLLTRLRSTVFLI